MRMFILTGLWMAVCAVSAHAVTYDVTLDSGQAVPTPMLGGATPSGAATVDVDTITGGVSISGTYAGLTSPITVSHLHGLAPPGMPAGVVFGLTNTGGTSGSYTGGATLAGGDLDGLLDGLTYINLHTQNNEKSEIRAQVVDSDIVVLDVPLTTQEAIPTPVLNGSAPAGMARVVFDKTSGEVEISGSYTGLTSPITVSHLHGLAPAGSPAGVLFGLTNTGGTDGTFSGAGVLAGGNLQGLLGGLTYINLHSQNHPKSEIRGQVVPEPSALGVLALAAAGGAAMRRRRRQVH